MDITIILKKLELIQSMTNPLPPIATKNSIEIKQLSFKRTDPYAWLKDENWQEVLTKPSCLKKSIRSYLEKENSYTESVMKPTQSLQQELFLSMKKRIDIQETSPQLKDGEWLYYSRFEQNSEYKSYYRQSIHNHQEILLFDANEEAKQSEYYKIGSVIHSPNHRYIAYTEDRQGSEIWQIRIKDLQTNSFLPQIITPCAGSFTFSTCSQYIFWVYRDNHGRPTKIIRHCLNSTTDTIIYEEKDAGFFLTVERSLSNQWIYIITHNHDTSEVWLISCDKPKADPIIIRKRQKGVFYEITDWQNQFIMKTNEGNAYNFKIIRYLISQSLLPSSFHEENWQLWIPHNPEIYLIEMIPYQNYFVRLERYKVNLRIVIQTIEGQEKILTGEEEAFTLSLDTIYDNKTNWLHYSYQSPTTPRHWYRYNMSTDEKEIVKIQNLPCGHTPDDYQTKRIWATAKDGETIPITLTYHKNTNLNGKTPVLLYGYGSYGYAIDPTFSINALNYLDHGWIYAIAHVRGGSEKGWKWFLDGRKYNKINSFTDFIACADYLIEQNYTQAKYIVADGRSAGGMIMGYIANARPDLFAGIIAVVPFVDVLNTMSDQSLPLTPPEWPEWGNPLQSEKDYQYIASYSPYDNIKKQDYPSILAMGGLTDPRVTYWEPAKWIAKLREYNTSNHHLLLKINMDSGHGGAAGRYSSLKEAAFIQAFAFSLCKNMSLPE